MAPISRERAERIARGQACAKCGEYTYKRLVVRPAPDSILDELHAVWIAEMTCGVCGLQQELGLDEDGDVMFAG